MVNPLNWLMISAAVLILAVGIVVAGIAPEWSHGALAYVALMTAMTTGLSAGVAWGLSTGK